MIAILAMIGIGVVLWVISKGLLKLSAWLKGVSQTTTDLIAIHKAQSQKQILRHTKIAEEQLQSITGEPSYAAYNCRVRSEIEDLIKEVNNNPHA